MTIYKSCTFVEFCFERGFDLMYDFVQIYIFRSHRPKLTKAKGEHPVCVFNMKEEVRSTSFAVLLSGNMI